MSIVSVSRRPGPPQDGQGTFTHSSACASGGLPLRLEVLDLGEHDGQLGLRHRHDPAGVAVDDGNRAAPVALAREAPVAEPEVDREAPAPFALEPLDQPAPALGGAARPSTSPELTSTSPSVCSVYGSLSSTSRSTGFTT